MTQMAGEVRPLRGGRPGHRSWRSFRSAGQAVLAPESAVRPFSEPVSRAIIRGP